MANARIVKKMHTRYLADFFVECSQDADWGKQMRALKIEDKLNSAELGFPEFFSAAFPETAAMNLEYSVERVTYADVPRGASCWWPVEANTHYYMAYPTQFPQSSIYMAIDFHDGHDECCGH